MHIYIYHQCSATKIVSGFVLSQNLHSTDSSGNNATQNNYTKSNIWPCLQSELSCQQFYRRLIYNGGQGKCFVSHRAFFFSFSAVPGVATRTTLQQEWEAVLYPALLIHTAGELRSLTGLPCLVMVAKIWLDTHCLVGGFSEQSFGTCNDKFPAGVGVRYHCGVLSNNTKTYFQWDKYFML